MKRWLRFALIPFLGVASASAFATPRLTPQACHSYPFVRPAHEVTHGDLMQELKDLLLVGYQAHAVDNDYPSDLEAAQQRLSTLYRHDCIGQSAATVTQQATQTQAQTE